MNELYTPPKSKLAVESNLTINLIEKLHHQSTWRLLGLTIITFGVYSAIYIKRQSDIINEYVDEQNRISNVFIFITFMTSIISVILMPIYIFGDFQIIDQLSDNLDTIFIILCLVWSFKAKNRLNRILETNQYDANWFNGIWVFMFQNLYINYKINDIQKYKMNGSGDW